MTVAQRAVCDWLLRFPGVHIHHVPGNRYAQIMPRWASDAARQHMIAVCEDAFDMYEVRKDSAPRWEHRGDGATPRLTFGTFRALHRRRWIRCVKYRPQADGWARMNYYQLTTAGKKALLECSAAARVSTSAVQSVGASALS
jgi:hypothetical protein